MIIEPNTKTDFYYVDGDYIEYLKQAETKSRGFTCVPNVHYWNTDKFVFGAVLLINDIQYFVPVTSYSKPQQDLLLLRDKKDNKVLGSIRFNYMIPVPSKCLHKLNIADLPTVQSRAHASKELAFCRRNRDRIYKTAKSTYFRVLSHKYPELTKHSCDFQLLEKAYIDYI
ncbi:MAG: type III toxin-antitoxin system ToxN/AbiQ family toxin [Ruminococcus sp.]|nr:type III toxin-antitoxin system ToxN/AbiQ family toxin [Ruminococcus sp.]